MYLNIEGHNQLRQVFRDLAEKNTSYISSQLKAIVASAAENHLQTLHTYCIYSTTVQVPASDRAARHPRAVRTSYSYVGRRHLRSVDRAWRSICSGNKNQIFRTSQHRHVCSQTLEQSIIPASLRDRTLTLNQFCSRLKTHVPIWFDPLYACTRTRGWL